MRAICAELKKSRRRHNALVAVGISLAALLWATQTGGKSEDVSQGYSGLLYAIPIINTVIMPSARRCLPVACGTWKARKNAAAFC